MATPKTDELRRHIERLCAEHDIEWRVSPVFQALADTRARAIDAPYVIDQVTYYTCLHEIGHLLAPGRTVGYSLDHEATAWQWALDRALVRPNMAVLRHLHHCLHTYIRKALRNQRMHLPLPDSLFWQLYDNATQ